MSYPIVTPMKGSDLVASGVLMEAYSVKIRERAFVFVPTATMYSQVLP